MKRLANLKSPFIIPVKLRREVVPPQKLSSEPCMVEEGKGKRKERVPEQGLRSMCRVDSRRNRVKGKRVRFLMKTGIKVAPR